MDVELQPPMHGCLIALITVMTLGLYPLLQRVGEKHFIRRMDDAGFETRGGQKFSWSDVRRIERVVGKVRGVKLSDEIVLHMNHARASLPTWRIANAQSAIEFVQNRVSHVAR